MSILVKEIRRRASRLSSSPSRERSYFLSGSSDIDDIEAALLSGTDAWTNAAFTNSFPGVPATDNSLPLFDLDISLHEGSSSAWGADATYQIGQQKTPAETGDEEISFEISPLTVAITRSLENLQRVKEGGGDAPDFQGGIGWDGEKFTGTEKMVEAFSFTILRYVPIATALSNAYINSLRAAAFHTNNAIFRGFDTGEVLYVGASGSQRNDDDFAISHKFLAGLNATNLSIGAIGGLQKKAWEYLWALYESEEDAAAKFVTPRPTSAYVERIYDPINYPTFIGVSA